MHLLFVLQFATNIIFGKQNPPSAILSIAFVLGFVFSLVFIYIPPFQTWFSFRPLSFSSLAGLALLTSIYFFIVDMLKVTFYKKTS
ncbi:MAG: cation transporting ATPase C-terminal domain-containing protein [Legionella sp.]